MKKLLCAVLIFVLTLAMGCTPDQGNKTPLERLSKGSSVAIDEQTLATEGEKFDEFFKYSLNEDQASYSVYIVEKEHAMNFALIEGHNQFMSLYADVLDICGILTLPDSYEGLPVTRVAEFGFACMPITDVKGGANIEKIEEGAFESCNLLRSVDIPEKVTVIGNSAFINCAALTEINGLDGVEEIGSGAFVSCFSLKEIEIPGTVKVIPSTLFSNCRGLRKITFGEGVEKIGADVVGDCYSLISVVIPSTVTAIGTMFGVNRQYFYEVVNNSSVEPDFTTAYGKDLEIIKRSIFMHEGESLIKTEGEFSFITRNGNNYLVAYDGDSLRVTLPESYNGEGYIVAASAFLIKPVLSVEVLSSAIGVDAITNWWNDIEIVYKTDEALNAESPDESGAEYKTESQIVKVGDFYFKEKDEKIYLVGYGGKGGVVTLPSATGVEYTISEYAFYFNTSVRKIIIKGSVTDIERDAFLRTSALVEIEISGGLKNIADGAFDCFALRRVTLPSGLETVDSFRLCSLLGEVNFLGTEAEWDELKQKKPDAYIFTANCIKITCADSTDSSEQES